MPTSQQKKYAPLFIKLKSFSTLIAKWLLLCALIGICNGTASAVFLKSLNWVTNFRENHIWLIALLPFAGFAIGSLYHYWGKDVVGGSSLLIENIEQPQKTIPLKMAPFVFLSTLLTHLFGGSAGREGTALQMAGAIADQFSHPFKLEAEDRKILTIAAIAGGFGAVFGTPIAGTIFGLEVFLIGKLKYNAILPAFATATIANITCTLWGATHTHYVIDIVPKISIANLAYAVIAGFAFGLCANVFSKGLHTLSSIFKKKIAYAPLRPVIGGAIIALAVLALGTTKYIGLGIPTIIASFQTQLPAQDFALKILLTVLTLSCGFKGGEVTPLFFIGATLGSWLSIYLGIPTGLLAGMGFVAVFAGATNTPLACTLMAYELFGLPCLPFVAIACLISYLISGNKSIYNHKLMSEAKFKKYRLLKRDQLQQL